MSELPTPRINPKLYGHDKAFAHFMQAFDGGRLAHAWILSGPKGIGKATFAYQLAKAVLAHGIQDKEATERRIIAGSHADFLVIEPAYDEKKEETKREITVEEARGLGEFLALTPGESDWRVVIVDSADELNTNAANAILKLLEEPPPRSLLLLVSHNPASLLPTIRSRCRTLKLAPLTAVDYQRAISHLLPELEYEEAAVLGTLTHYAPGLAIETYLQNGLLLYGELVALLETYPKIDRKRLISLAERFAGGSHKEWRLFTRLLLAFLSRMVMGMEEEIVPGERLAADNLRQLRPEAAWSPFWFDTAEQFLVAEKLHLDYKTVILTFFESLAISKAA